MRLVCCLMAVVVAGCAPASSRETPVAIEPGSYIIDWPKFVKVSPATRDAQHCVHKGTEDQFPSHVTRAVLDAMPQCTMTNYQRTGNSIELEARCTAWETEADGTMTVTGQFDVMRTEIAGNYAIDMSELTPKSKEAEAGLALMRAARFRLAAKRIGDC